MPPVLPLDSTHGSLSTDYAELLCNWFGLFYVNEKHIQLGLHRISPECLHCSVWMQLQKCKERYVFCTWATLVFFSFCKLFDIVHTVHPNVMPLCIIYTHTYTHRHTPALNNDFSHSSAISPVRARCKEKRRMILSHMRYNSPVDSSTEQGDRRTEGRQREAGGGCLSVTRKEKESKDSWIFLRCC